ncbi:SEFIR domain-containing protein [Thermohalobacter berrensis]|uniref:SEFIR domain-containing protein n=1 Tax=Thermohalobacter berrensis TaxID=99594 RepID=A0A419T9M9_9FIRM|nr:SEFIR domain-containing protein [Thermohalobacter berrensis]RKD34173.1 hypothetical protein BET03_07740 [Thermohalobacter berrensis]
MEDNSRVPRVFISYSWSSQDHENWVLELAERLVNDGIDVILDKWNLKEGQDKYVFMEKSIKREDVDKILVICDKVYQEKADERKGGVGTESQIISKEVYEDTGQEKFIPIIKEFDENGQPFLPTFFSTRIYLDFSDHYKYEESYEKLVRSLYGKPMYKKPKLGSPPPYILEDEVDNSKTKYYVKQIENAILNNKKFTKGLIVDFLDKIIESLDEYRIYIDNTSNINEFDELVIDNINKLIPLRNDFIKVVDIIFKYKEHIDLNKFHRFWEEIIKYQYKTPDMSSYYQFQFDNFKFFIYELFLYFITILLKLEKYEEASFFINATYFYKINNYGELVNGNISEFNNYVESLEQIRQNRLKLNRISITADLIKERANIHNIKFRDIVETDYLLFFITINNSKDSIRQDIWVPRCSVYNSYHRKPLIFEKMISARHFEKVKILFKVNTPEEFKNMILKTTDLGIDKDYYKSFYRIISINKVVDIEKLATLD